MNFNIIKWVKNPSYAKGRVDNIQVMPESMATNLQKKELLIILKSTDMVKCEVIKPLLYDGVLRNKGEVIEVSYEKAERLANIGELKIIEFESEVSNVDAELPEQDAEVGVVEQKPAKAKSKATVKTKK